MVILHNELPGLYITKSCLHEKNHYEVKGKSCQQHSIKCQVSTEWGRQCAHLIRTVVTERYSCCIYCSHALVWQNDALIYRCVWIGWHKNWIFIAIFFQLQLLYFFLPPSIVCFIVYWLNGKTKQNMYFKILMKMFPNSHVKLLRFVYVKGLIYMNI